MRRLTLTLLACALAARGLGAQQTRADSLRQKAIRDSIALMQALQAAATPSQQAPTGGAQGPTNPRLLPDVSAVGDLVGDLSPKGSTQEDKSRLGIREVEIAIQAVVDPYFRGDVFLGFSDAEGVAIEQAFLTTTSLRDLELRLGRQLMPFGKQNTTHRHDLHTTEYPYVIQRFFGPEGLKGTGLFASKVFAPFGFYQELLVSAIDRLGEAPEDLVTIDPVNKELGGLGYSARFRNYFDVSQSSNFELSASALTGKIERPIVDENGDVVTVDDANAVAKRQTTLGFDATFRWRPLQQGLYKSFIVQAELMRQLNEHESSDAVAALPRPIPSRDYTGGYVFARYQLSRRLFLGGRFDAVEDPTADGRSLKAGSGYLEWYPSEFSKLSAGYERVTQTGATGLNRILLQATFALGPHKPHPF
jgi:hypothetical protein